MLSISKKYVVDDSGKRKEVIISYEDFRVIEELQNEKKSLFHMRISVLLRNC